jgi:hypothetical protein
MAERFKLQYRWALGDTIILTALARDLAALGHTVDVDVRYPEVFANNPHVQLGAGGRVVDLSVQRSRRLTKKGAGVHIAQALYDDFEAKTGLKVTPSTLAGDLHFSAAEHEPLFDGAYWVVLAGSRADLTVKQWPPKFYQRVVDELADEIRFVQVGVANDLTYQPALHNVLDLVGRTDIRTLLRVVAQSSGVLSSITGVMHAAAALGKPAVTVAGGIETPAFTHYREGHSFLHTIGELGCCQTAGCERPYALGSGPEACKHQRFDGSVPTPLCMQLVSPFRAVAEIRQRHVPAPKAQSTTLPLAERRPVAAPVPPRPAISFPLAPPTARIRAALWAPADWSATKANQAFKYLPADTTIFRAHEITKADALVRLRENADLVAWFDAESIVVRKNWADQLVEAWHANRQRCKLYGRRLRYDLYADAGDAGLAWFRRSPWHRGLDLFTPGRDVVAPNGVELEAVDPGFWAIDGEYLAGWTPDSRAATAGFEVVLAEQMRQQGFRIKSFSDGGSPVYSPPRPLDLAAAPWRRP